MIAWLIAALAQEPATIARCSVPPRTLPDAFEAVRSAVVRVETKEGTGSGVAVSPDGWVLTAAHVVGVNRTVTLVRDDGTRAEGEVVRVAVAADLALLHTDTALPCAPMAAAPVQPGNNVYVVGSPGGEALSHSISRGIASGWRQSEEWTVLQTDASINPGNSGGPAFDDHGEVQAIVSFKAAGSGIEGLGFAIGVGSVERALGVRVGEATAGVGVWHGTRRSGWTPRPAGQTISQRPATPAVYDATKACRTVEEETTRGSGPTGTTWRTHGELFRIEQTAARTTLILPYRAEGGFADLGLATAGLQPGFAGVDLLLQDGTLLQLGSASGVATFASPNTTLQPEFTLDAAALDALASSPVQRIAWDLQVFEPSEVAVREAAALRLQTAAACATTHLAGR